MSESLNKRMSLAHEQAYFIAWRSPRLQRGTDCHNYRKRSLGNVQIKLNIILHFEPWMLTHTFLMNHWDSFFLLLVKFDRYNFTMKIWMGLKPKYYIESHFTWLKEKKSTEIRMLNFLNELLNNFSNSTLMRPINFRNTT